MSWPMCVLGDVAPAKPIKLNSFKQSDNFWQVTLDHIESGTGRLLERNIKPLSEAGTSTHAFDERHVLYSKLRPYLNKVLLPDGIGIGTTELVPMLPDPERLDRDYLAYYLKSNIFVNWVSSQTAGAKMPRVSMNTFWEHEIPLPPLPEQKRIAAILDKADSLRRKNQQAIQLADKFLRAVFLDMFGDPVTNPKGFKPRLLKEFYFDENTGTKCGPFGSALKKEEYVESGIPVWNMDNINLSGKFIDKPNLWITEAKFEELEPYSIKPGDVIISRAGTVGKMGVVRSKHSKSIISTNLIRVRFGCELLPEYFVSLMTYCKTRFGRLKTGPDGSFTHMNTGILDNLEFPYPPVSIQSDYLLVRNKLLDTLKKAGYSEKLSNDAFGAISQKAFAGEL
ncbi:restriction endonuclease subunit S [Methylomicrobium lacus]|uniref:restriction endonuclease subunit S n=1 Tax=Methylomicrobium lacus TaxID=136992 RepID=UPI00045E7584|nr:restriction endonuclease subunit S [Methylomicrobium lacus]